MFINLFRVSGPSGDNTASQSSIWILFLIKVGLRSVWMCWRRRAAYVAALSTCVML